MHLITDGSMSRNVIVPASGTVRHPTDDAVGGGDFKFRLVEPEAMKARLGEVSIDNWLACVDTSLEKSGTQSDGIPYTREDIDFFNMSLVKPSAYREMLDRLGLTEDQGVSMSSIGRSGLCSSVGEEGTTGFAERLEVTTAACNGWRRLIATPIEAVRQLVDASPCFGEPAVVDLHGSVGELPAAEERECDRKPVRGRRSNRPVDGCNGVGL